MWPALLKLIPSPSRRWEMSEMFDLSESGELLRGQSPFLNPLRLLVLAVKSFSRRRFLTFSPYGHSMIGRPITGYNFMSHLSSLNVL